MTTGQNTENITYAFVNGLYLWLVGMNRVAINLKHMRQYRVRILVRNYIGRNKWVEIYTVAIAEQKYIICCRVLRFIIFGNGHVCPN